MINSFIALRKENGYALLLSILVLSTMLTIGLTVTSVITTQVRLTRRVFDAMKALAAADSGIERGLYADFNGTFTGSSIDESGPPKYTVTKTGGPATNLVAAYAFDEGSGATTDDNSGNDHTGSLLNGAGWAAGHSVNAVSLNDGTQDYVRVGASADFDLNSGWTIEAWIKRSSTGSQDDIVERYSWDLGYGGYAMRVGNDNLLYAYNVQGEGFDWCESGTTTIDAGAWYHVAATFDSATDTLTCYVGGEVKGTKTTTRNPIADSTFTLKIGAQGDGSAGNTFNGLIDDLRIWSSVRSQTDIQFDMNNAVSGTTTLKSVGSFGKAQRSVEVNY